MQGKRIRSDKIHFLSIDPGEIEFENGTFINISARNSRRVIWQKPDRGWKLNYATRGHSYRVLSVDVWRMERQPRYDIDRIINVERLEEGEGEAKKAALQVYSLYWPRRGLNKRGTKVSNL